ncbi:MAG: HIT domain-containing protein [Candidatus Gracilibacteria bacterium]
MKNCIFCKISNNEKKAYVVYQDDEIIVFLDRSQASEGHLLVATKTHYENIFDVPEKTLESLIRICQKMARLCKEKLNCTGVNIVHSTGADAQQDVFHIHFHVIPRYPDSNLEIQFKQKAKNTIPLENIFKKFQ